MNKNISVEEKERLLSEKVREEARVVKEVVDR